jgi:hypothetical protein
MRDYPLLVFLVSTIVLLLATWAGASIWGRQKVPDDDTRADFSRVSGATLTLLGLLIGFTLSMAVSRYDSRKSNEEGEANAIGTEFLRAELLPVADAQRVRVLLTSYIDLRIRDYRSRDGAELQRLKDQMGRLQDQLWTAVRMPATAQPTPTMALVASGMNDVLNAQGYAQAAWGNRLPREVWWLMSAIAVLGCGLVGHGVRKFGTEAHFIWVLPAVISIAFFLIADIDSPRGGLIRVTPVNLLDTAQSMHASMARPVHV